MTPPDAARTLRVMPVGDSVTAAYLDNPTWSVPFSYGYREPLYRSLVAAGKRFTYAGESLEPFNGLSGDPTLNPLTSNHLTALGQDKHRGYGGQGTGFIGDNIVAWVNSDRPDIVLLDIGKNDIPQGSAVDPVSARAGLQSIIARIFDAKPDVHVVAAQICPFSTDTPAIGIYNDYIRDTLVPAFLATGHSISTVDLFNALLNGAATSPALFSNGTNHPQPDGYARIADAWLPAALARF